MAPPAAAIRLLVGLGNVGPEYEDTRHNAGFWFIDRLARRFGARLETQRKFYGQAARVQVAGRDLWLLKPGTFMNRSGQAVGALAAFYKIGAAEILVAHDELDLPAGGVRMKFGGGVAGHNGLKDIRAALGTADFWRLRFGIGHPRTLNLQQDVVDFVLHPPRRTEQDAIDGALARAQDVADLVAQGQFERAMMVLHTDAAQPRPSTPRTPPAPANKLQPPVESTMAQASGLLQTLFRYKAWANQDLFATVAALPESAHAKEKHDATRILNHVHIVDQIFRANVQRLAHPFTALNTPETPAIADLRAAAGTTDQWYVDYTKDLSDDQLAERIDFRFADGSPGRMTRGEMLVHVLTHGNYHRGAVGRILFQLGVAPPPDSLTVFLHK